jgi:signal transduction histidine kinase
LITPDAQPGQRTFAQRLGGRWAVSVAGHLITFPLGVIGMSEEILRLGWPDGALILAGLLVAYGLSGIVDVILDRTRWSNRRVEPVPAEEVIVRLVLVGVTIGAVFAVIRATFGIATPAGALGGLIVYPLIAVWAGVTVIVHLDVIDQARSLRKRLVIERASAVDIVDRATVAVRDVRARVDALLAPEIDRLRTITDIAEPVDARSVPGEIRDMVDRSVRNVGRELWRRSGEAPSRIGPVDVLRSLIAEPVFRPWPIIGLAVLAPLLEDPSIISLPLMMFVVVITAALLAECALANRLLARGRAWHAPVVIATIAVFSGQSLIVDRIDTWWIQQPESPGVVAVVVLTVLLMAATSALGSYRDLNDRRALLIAEAIAADRLDAAAHAHVVSDETRRLAALLHGRVQSRLLGCAMAIEFAGDDPTAITAALDRTSEVLAEGWTDAGDTIDASGSAVTARLDAIRAAWAGLSAIEVVGAESLPPHRTDEALTVIEELIANAVRHGHAGRVVITIEPSPGHLEITAVDDGTGGVDPGRPGLGSSVLSRVGSVERIPGPAGWSVTVRIPT